MYLGKSNLVYLLLPWNRSNYDHQSSADSSKEPYRAQFMLQIEQLNQLTFDVYLIGNVTL